MRKVEGGGGGRERRLNRRARVVEMENQLSSLSSLVHSALMSKGTNDSVFKVP